MNWFWIISDDSKKIKNQCFNLIISEKDLAALAFQGMCSYFREKIGGSYLSFAYTIAAICFSSRKPNQEHSRNH
jgi:hypothetical protein